MWLTRFRGVVLVAGTAACLLPLAIAFASLDAPLTEVPGAVIAMALLFSPYLALANYGASAAPLIGYSALALIVAGTALVIIAATSDPQGGLAAIYVVPAQWLVAWGVGRRRFRRP